VRLVATPQLLRHRAGGGRLRPRPHSHKVTLFDIHMKYGDELSLAEVQHYLRGVKDGEATLL